MLRAGFMLGAAGFLGWYCWRPLRGVWKLDGTALVDDGIGE
jgi:hypothetical protein